MNTTSDPPSGFKKYLNYSIVKIVLFLIFILFFYDIILNICLFFGIEGSYVYMYSGWIVFLFLLLIVLPYDNGVIKYIFPTKVESSNNILAPAIVNVEPSIGP